MKKMSYHHVINASYQIKLINGIPQFWIEICYLTKSAIKQLRDSISSFEFSLLPLFSISFQVAHINSFCFLNFSLLKRGQLALMYSGFLHLKHTNLGAFWLLPSPLLAFAYCWRNASCKLNFFLIVKLFLAFGVAWMQCPSSFAWVLT